MAKTSTDVTNEALRMIGVTAVDEDASADDHARAKQHLDAIYAELDETHGLALSWTAETVPDRVWLSMAKAVAGSICTSYALDQYAAFRQIGIGEIMRDEYSGQPVRSIEATYF